MAIGDTNPITTQSGNSYPDDDAAHKGPESPTRWRTVGNIWQKAFDVIFPPLCLGCQLHLANHDSLCPTCWRQIDFIRPPLCDRLGLPLPYDIGGTMISAAAVADPPPYDRARAVASYSGLMRKLIHDFKFNDSHNARRLFGRWLCQAAPQLIDSADCIVPVPLARTRLLGRRYNQAQLLAAEISRQTGKPVLSLALLRTRSTARQVGLTRLERQRNVSGAFAIAPGYTAEIAGKSVLLIDDIVTTGATVSAAAKTLKKAGASHVDVLTLALVTDAAA